MASDMKLYGYTLYQRWCWSRTSLRNAPSGGTASEGCAHDNRRMAPCLRRGQGQPFLNRNILAFPPSIGRLAHRIGRGRRRGSRWGTSLLHRGFHALSISRVRPPEMFHLPSNDLRRHALHRGGDIVEQTLPLPGGSMQTYGVQCDVSAGLSVM